ncbi:MAG: MgtC/SapB family protein [Oscillospiraceae bacterium]|jgi:putative Mg2+ transporter-C (MgtC) family protein|nr:MgtC/SapB family protein [Oscillospiraceae bacterium]
MAEIKEVLLALWGNEHINIALRTLGRLAVAVALGGIIGYEREHSHRPAGLRTHILVAVGSALVMCTSSYIFSAYNETFAAFGSAPDPSRLGAQVISGIGFLGAGTILREGFSVKGLTTAASLWAVSCIGLAVGIGFWSGALIATLVIYLTLNALKKVTAKHSHERTLYIGVSDADSAAEKVVATLRNCGAKMQSMELIFPDESFADKFSRQTTLVLKAFIYVHNHKELALIKESLLGLTCIHDFYVE